VPYASAVKVGLQFKRRFWEEDEVIYGGRCSVDWIASFRLANSRRYARA
jgi:monoamine oxidase